MLKKTNKFSKRSTTKNKNDYQSLEDRRLLAVTSIFEFGELTIALDETGDSAVLTEVAGEVSVNGAVVDMDPIQDGLQPLMVSDITRLTISGDAGASDLSIELNGSFDTTDIELIDVNGIQTAVVNGSYSTNQLSGNLVGDSGFFTVPGTLIVTSDVNLNSDDDFSFVFDSGTSDFSGAVSITTGGNIRINDAANNLVLRNISARNMTLTAEGTITNTRNPSIIVPGASNFTAEVVNLGNNGGVVDLFVIVGNTESTFSLNEFDTVVWGNQSTVGFANIQAGFVVSMGPNASLTVNGDAFFDVDRLRLGIGGSNTFNAERININTNRNAVVWENSSIELFGDNTAADIDLFSSGDITNSENASIVVEGISSFQALGNVSIGNADGDTFNSGEVRFFASDVNFSEDSGLVIGGRANRAVNLMVNALGTIEDTDEAFVVIVENGTFISDGGAGNSGIVLGDSAQDDFFAGTISFQVEEGDFSLAENDGTNVASINGFVNVANNADIRASGGDALNDPDSIIQIDGTAALAGNNVSFGQMPNDNVQFGEVNVITDGNAAINLNGDVMLTGTSFVGGDFSVNSVGGSVEDSDSSILTVLGTATLVGPGGITIGDLNAPQMPGETGDLFEAGVLRVVSNGGEVDISQNNNIVLTGENNATVMRLESTGNGDDIGSITNLPGVDINVVGNLFLTANGDIDLGSNVGDSVNFDNLNFSSLGDVAISAFFEDEENEIFIFGTSNNPNEADEFRLTTNVDVFDGNNAVIDVETFFRIEGRDITLGDTDTDCLMIPENSEFQTSSGNPENVNPDTDCPDP